MILEPLLILNDNDTPRDLDVSTKRFVEHMFPYTHLLPPNLVYSEGSLSLRIQCTFVGTYST